MTKNQFTVLCEKHSIAPCIALEDENLTELLRGGATVAEIDAYLQENF